MYTINYYEDHNFQIVEINNSENSSWIKICPERGGIILGYGVRGKERLFLNKETFYNKDKNIRGGIPILFPIAGQLPNGQYEWEGKAYSMPNHGFGRISEWKIIDRKETADSGSVSLMLRSNKETEKYYPFQFESIVTYELKNEKLLIQFSVKNLDERFFPVHVGFHPYFNAGSKSIRVDTGSQDYFDYNDNTEKIYTGEMSLEGMDEAVVFKNNTNLIKTCFANVDINITCSEDYKYTMLWTQHNQDFICVEPWTAKTNEFNRKEELLMISPGKNFVSSVEFEVIENITNSLNKK
jgi:galactose mutarotase-like enzyme